MGTFDRTLKASLPIYAALLLVFVGLLVFSPAEATLGNVVKIVYAHGAAQRIATYGFLIAGVLGIAQVALRNPAVVQWTQAVAETAIVFWLAQLVISLPAQILAWGGIMLNEPRVAGALWILALTALVYGVARWIGEARWMAMGAMANAVIVMIVLRDATNILHPIDPIIVSDSLAIKAFYAAIVMVTGLVAFQFARDRAR